jgi:NAD(P)-dependent dehydrogenase (short-subunit alcohol dehydrogenase family)
LINNAGIKGSKHQSRDDMDYDAWAETFAVNAMAPLRVTEALLPKSRPFPVRWGPSATRAPGNMPIARPRQPSTR